MENEKEHSVTDIDEARAAMAEIRAAEQRLSQRITWPFWRHFAVGLAFGVLMIGLTLEGGASIFVSAGVMVFALWLRNDDKKRHGMFVNGWSRGPTLWVSSALLVGAVAAVFFVDRGIAQPQREQPLFWMLVAAVLAGGTVGSYLWQAVYQRSLRGKVQ